MTKILISGYYGFRNSGDDAILDAMRTILAERAPEAELTVLSYRPQETADDCHVRAVNRFGLLSVWRAVRGCDVLVSGGGSLLQDRTSTRSLLYYLSIIRLARLCGKKTMVFANGIGPIAKPANRRRTRRVLAHVDRITVREQASREELLAIGVEQPPPIVTADPVFASPGVDNHSARRLLSSEGIPTDRKLLAVALRPWPGMDSQAPLIAELLDRVARDFDVSVVFMPMQTPGDAKIGRKVKELMREQAYLMETAHTSAEWIGITGEMELVLAMRLHALIFAAKRHVPTVGFIYDPKITAYLERLQMPAAGTIGALDVDAAYAAVAHTLQNRAQCVETLRQKTEELADQANENFTILLDLIRQG